MCVEVSMEAKLYPSDGFKTTLKLNLERWEWLHRVGAGGALTAGEALAQRPPHPTPARHCNYCRWGWLKARGASRRRDRNQNRKGAQSKPGREYGFHPIGDEDWGYHRHWQVPLQLSKGWPTAERPIRQREWLEKGTYFRQIRKNTPSSGPTSPRRLSRAQLRFHASVQSTSCATKRH